MNRLIAVSLVMVAIALLVASCIEPTPTVSPTPTYPPSPLPGGQEGESQPLIDLETILQWIVDNQELIALAAAFGLSLVNGGMKSLKSFGIGLMLDAEKRARDDVQTTGPDKMAEVIQKFVEKLPPAAKQVLSAYAAIRGQTIHALVYDMCQKWYDKAVNDGE